MADLIIYPGFNPLYYTYYLSALLKRFKNENVYFKSGPFPDFYPHCLAFIVNDKREKKYFISAGDGPVINELGLDWCDTYAKVNYEPSCIPERGRDKIISIGPGFGIRMWGFGPTLFYAFKNSLLSRKSGQSMGWFFYTYLSHFFFRATIAHYRPSSIAENYLFFASCLWIKEEDTNEKRAAYIDACLKQRGMTFEGGFIRRKEPSMQKYKDFFLSRSYRMSEYLEKISKSTVVFNTPAVNGCLGWKLGEFLALGKAILSTPLKRQMPFPLNHGEHVHFVEGDKASIQKGLETLLADRSYREHLQKNARKYYEDHLAPDVVIKRLIGN